MVTSNTQLPQIYKSLSCTISSNIQGNDCNNSNCSPVEISCSCLLTLSQLDFKIVVLTVNFEARKEQETGRVFADEDLVVDDGFLRERLQNVITKKHSHLRSIHTKRLQNVITKKHSHLRSIHTKRLQNVITQKHSHLRSIHTKRLQNVITKKHSHLRSIHTELLQSVITQKHSNLRSIHTELLQNVITKKHSDLRSIHTELL